MTGLSDPFINVWAYQVSPEAVDEFYELYGPDGSWIDLFRRAAGYVDTQLLVDHNQPGRFLTIDRWESQGAFESFRAEFAEEYQRLDLRGEQLTLSESALGEFGLAQTTDKP